MKSLILVFLFLGISMLYIGCSDNNPATPQLNQSDQVTNTLAKKPVPNLTGEVDTDFVPDGNPVGTDYYWNGIITIDGEPYGMRFLSLTPPRGYSGAFPFKERFEIYENGFLGVPEHLLLEGPNHGVVSFANDRFRANGKIEVANAPFEMWDGRNVHISGIVTWAIEDILPAGATGTFRIN
jgi:hypothetical protein